MWRGEGAGSLHGKVEGGGRGDSAIGPEVALNKNNNPEQ